MSSDIIPKFRLVLTLDFCLLKLFEISRKYGKVNSEDKFFNEWEVVSMIYNLIHLRKADNLL